MTSLANLPARAVAGWDLIHDSLVLTGRSLLRLKRAPGKLIFISINPLVMLLTVGYLFKNSIVVPGADRYEEYIMAGVAVQVGLSSLGPTAIGMATDVQGGIMDRLLSLPISRVGVLVGHTMSDLLCAMMSLCIVVAAGAGLGWRFHAGLISVVAGFLLVVAFIYTMLWVGVALGLMVRNMETIDSLSALVLILLSFLSNAFLSVEGLPGWIRPLADWNPVSAVVSACRQLWGNPTGPANSFASQHPTLIAVVFMATILVGAVAMSLAALRRAASN